MVRPWCPLHSMVTTTFSLSTEIFSYLYILFLPSTLPSSLHPLGTSLLIRKARHSHILDCFEHLCSPATTTLFDIRPSSFTSIILAQSVTLSCSGKLRLEPSSFDADINIFRHQDLPASVPSITPWIHRLLSSPRCIPGLFATAMPQNHLSLSLRCSHSCRQRSDC